MWDRVDRLGVIVLDSGLASIVLLAIATLAMIVSRQPARRLRLARTAMFGLLATLPLIGLKLVPRFDLVEYFREIDVAEQFAGFDAGAINCRQHGLLLTLSGKHTES